MRKFAVFCVLCASIAGIAAPAFRMSKAKPMSIVVSLDAIPSEKTAANELHDYIKKLCGVDCSILNEKEAKKPAIYVGHTELAKNKIDRFEKLGDEEWAIFTYQGNLIITGGRPRGTLYGVYEFLEMLGVVWPDETTEYVPSLPEIKFDKPLSIRNKPAMMGRCIYSGFYMPSKAARQFYIRNKMNHNLKMPAEYGYSVFFGSSGGCHTFHNFTRPDWPDEWFAADASGKRVRSTSGSGPGQLCLMNPDLRKAMVKRLREFIAEDRKSGNPAEYPHIYDISHNDNGNHCVCEKCKAMAEQEGSYSGPMLDFINYIANDIAKDYPDIIIQTFAYTWTLDAPKHIKPAKNVMVRICKLGIEFYPQGKADTLFPISHERNTDYRDNFNKWAMISKNMAVWDYWIIYTKGDHTPPYVNFPTIQEDIKFYVDNGVKTMFVECENPANTSFTYFKYWFGLKMMQDPTQSFSELSKRFCKAYYGPAAGPMREYMEYLQARETAADICLATSAISFKNFYNLDRKRPVPDLLPYLDKEFFLKANNLLDEAERLAAGNKTCIEHIRNERLPVDFALLNSISKYRTSVPCGKLIKNTPQALLERYSEACIAQAKKYYASDIYKKEPGKYQDCLNRLESLKATIDGASSKLPKQFQDKECFVLTSEMLGGAVDDPTSPSGKSKKLAEGKTENYHRLPFSLGVYTRNGGKFKRDVKLNAEDIKQDGKFHWYSLGKADITPTTIVWLHWSWMIQCVIDGAYLGENTDNNWEVFACVKFTGAPYVNKSKEPGQVYINSIILAK